MPSDDTTIALRQDRAAQLLQDLFSKASSEIKPLEEPEPETVEAATVPELREAVRKIRKRGGKPYSVRDRIAEAVFNCLSAAGAFHRGDDGRLFYFKNHHHTLDDLSSKDFERFLARASGLNQKEIEFQFVLTDLQNRAAELPVTPIHSLAFFDWASGKIFVDNGAGMMCVRPRRGEWSLVPNGAGALFLTQPGSEPFSADFSKRGAALDWLLDQASFHDDAANLTRADQRTLLLTTVLFGLCSNKTRIILVGNGLKGSGKSTAMQNVGLVLHGSKFRGTGSMRDRPLDDTVIALKSRAILLLDNVDSYIKGIEDVLACFATGIEHSRRTLYEDSAETVIKLVTSILMITARTARFARDDVAERSVPLSFLAPATRIGETEMSDSVLGKRDAIMGDILSRLAEIADRLEYVKPPRLGFRMADFAAFGWVMHASQKDGRWVSQEWESLLEKLTLAQDRFVGSDGALVTVLDHVLTEQWEVGTKGRPVRCSIYELFSACRDKAIKLSIMLPKTAIRFGQIFTQQKNAIQTALGVVIREEYKHAGERFITIFRKPEVTTYYLNGALPGVTVQFSPNPIQEADKAPKY